MATSRQAAVTALDIVAPGKATPAKAASFRTFLGTVTLGVASAIKECS